MVVHLGTSLLFLLFVLVGLLMLMMKVLVDVVVVLRTFVIVLGLKEPRS